MGAISIHERNRTHRRRNPSNYDASRKNKRGLPMATVKIIEVLPSGHVKFEIRGGTLLAMFQWTGKEAITTGNCRICN